ncbi:MAG: hypothetical protein JST79_20300 [Acidobacteria bacterium]|jgi:hypothetical protein|nr:hypothetical protein [Acidobacteriota bacterium]
MEATGKQKIQIVLALLIVVAGLRAAYVIYERRAGREEAAQEEKRAAPPLNPDYYVTPKRLRPYDLKSARQLSQQPVWVKEGYRYSYYAYDSARRRSDFSHPAGVLLPIEKLQIKDVATDVTPGAADQKQVIAIFAKEGKTYAVPIGTLSGSDYQIYSDEMFYIEDPRQLYKHWPADIWESIAKHEVKPGMNELQADFAIGMGMPERSADSSSKTVHYPNGGSPMTITYRNGRAAEIVRNPS